MLHHVRNDFIITSNAMVSTEDSDSIDNTIPIAFFLQSFSLHSSSRSPSFFYSFSPLLSFVFPIVGLLYHDL
jgi:hypothetical protein